MGPRACLSLAGGPPKVGQRVPVVHSSQAQGDGHEAVCQGHHSVAVDRATSSEWPECEEQSQESPAEGVQARVWQLLPVQRAVHHAMRQVCW